MRTRLSALPGATAVTAFTMLVRIALDIVPCNNKLPTASVKAPGSEASGSYDVRPRAVPFGEVELEPAAGTPPAKVI